MRRLESRVADAFGLSHTIAVPLAVDAGLVGAIVLSRRTAVPWSDAARRRLALSAAEASAALERVYSLSDAEARAATDALTGLPNRRRFDEHVASSGRRRRAGDRTGVLMIDLDFFKRLNDTCGHLAGDRVLVAVGRAIAASVRDVDLPARVGGEEFAVILRDPLPERAVEVAERVRAAIAAIDLSAEGIPAITASVGVAVSDDPDVSIHAVVEQADAALLRAKRDGRDRVEVA
ncbi:MAG: GGDEF domain-containing protein [Chloroflexota bacterium]